MPEFSPTQYAVPLFVVAVLAEMVWSRLRNPEAYEPMDTLVSLAFGLGSTVTGALLGGFAAYLFFAAYQYRVFDFGPEWWSVWWAWPLCFVLDDLKYYCVHRAGHHDGIHTVDRDRRQTSASHIISTERHRRAA